MLRYRVQETVDPLAALNAKDIPTRAAGARDLAAAGTPDHLSRLLDLAVRDPSPGVRLGVAAAAADILSRGRLPPAASAIPEAKRTELWMHIRGTDPGLNTGIFQVCATLGVPDAVSRILGGMRDPRVDVRMGACVGLQRLCISAAVNGDTALETRVVALFDDPRIRPETQAEIARVCANVGYGSALERIRILADQGQRTIATIATEALQRLEWPGSGAGIWVDLGLDAAELGPRPDGPASPRTLVALTGSDTLIVAGVDSSRSVPLKHLPRRLWLKRPGETEIGQAVQIELTTYWPADTDEVGELGDRLLAAEAFDLIALVDPLLPPSAATERLRGAALLRGGDPLAAVRHLRAGVEMKKVPTDTWWYLADALFQLGLSDEARPHLEKYIAKATKRAPHLAEARSRLGD